MRPVLVISPHLDDAVLSCGQFLAGRPDAIVATVFAGIPEDGVTDYDRKCGFATSAEAMTVRRAEDVTACAMLAANTVHMPFLDSQYSTEPALHGRIANAITELIDRCEPEFVVGPLGIAHPDHIKVGQAMGMLSADVFLYEELPYAVTQPGAADEARQRWAITPAFVGDGLLARKLHALWCYRSQMRLPEFTNPAVFTVPERFWRVTG